MMERLARLLVGKRASLVVVLLSLVIVGICGRYALRVDQDDDLLAFLPADNPAVTDFRRINGEFGGLDVAIVGIDAGDPFAGPFLQKLEAVTRRLNDEESITHALSLANVEDFILDETKGGMVAKYLASPPPEDEAASAALRETVMAKDHIVGNLVSADGKKVIIYAFLAAGAQPRATAEKIRTLVTEAFPELPTYWGGAPFISTYIYDTTRADMRDLIPWAVVVIVLIIVASFRDVVGALLALGSTGMGIVITYGLMGMTGVDANIVLGSMPVILFAVGSAYAIHVMVRYYARRMEEDVEDALVHTLVETGPVVLAAGLTTVVGLLSFMAMDIVPMQQFGLYTGVGIFATLVLSLTFVPAVVRLLGLEGRHFAESRWGRGLAALATWSEKRRLAVAGGLGLLAVAGALLAGRVEARMENAAFFNSGSPPDQAETFLRDAFGGSQFIQVMVEGDMYDPDVLRELERVADRIALEDHVSSVSHLGQVLSLLNEGFTGERRLPTQVDQVHVLYRFLQGRAVLNQFVIEDKTRSLMQIKIDTDRHEDVAALLDRIEKIIAEDAVHGFVMVGRELGKDLPEAASETMAAAAPDPRAQKLAAYRKVRVATRVAALLKGAGAAIDEAKIAEKLDRLPTEPDPATVRGRLALFLRSGESLLEPSEHGHADALAAAISALGPGADSAAVEKAARDALLVATPLPEDCEDLPEGAEPPEGEEADACATAQKKRLARREQAADVALSVETPLREMWRAARSARRADALAAELHLPEAAATRTHVPLAAALLDLDRLGALLPDPNAKAPALGYTVTGTPVLYRGLALSVTENQLKSLGYALALVLVILVVVFRSVTSGLLAAVPTILTLLAIYGVMGARGLHLDIGTSMLASIIIGAGVDYAVHLLAAWRRDGEQSPAASAAEHAGPAIGTNAIMVAAGFFVLTLGEAKPLENVGGLTSAAMICAALATFVALPALARRERYR
ncbi:MAG: MMPL family transporter [Polyangiaceae bacterium]